MVLQFARGRNVVEDGLDCLALFAVLASFAVVAVAVAGEGASLDVPTVAVAGTCWHLGCCWLVAVAVDCVACQTCCWYSNCQ